MSLRLKISNQPPDPTQSAIPNRQHDPEAEAFVDMNKNKENWFQPHQVMALQCSSSKPSYIQQTLYRENREHSLRG